MSHRQRQPQTPPRQLGGPCPAQSPEPPLQSGDPDQGCWGPTCGQSTRARRSLLPGLLLLDAPSSTPRRVSVFLPIPRHCDHRLELTQGSINLALRRCLMAKPAVTVRSQSSGLPATAGCKGASTPGPLPASPAGTGGFASSALRLCQSAPHDPHVASAVPHVHWAPTPLLDAPSLRAVHCIT